MVHFTRRAFLEVTGGLVIGFALPLRPRPFTGKRLRSLPFALA
jgi:hypothetical protein